MDNTMLTWNNNNRDGGEGCSSLSMNSSSTDDDTTSIHAGFMLASAHPKKRAGRKKFKETRHPVFRGVRLRSSGKWVCELREPNKKSRIWLGTFETAEMAARAHDVASMTLRGSSATLNFADSAWRLPTLPATSTAKEIQRAAAEAADAFRPRQGDSAAGTESGDVVAAAPNNDVAPLQTEMHWEEQVSSYTEMHRGEQVSSYIDEEAVFGMPGLVAEMYQGMMLPMPLPSYDYDDVEFYDDVPLWSHSV